VLAFLFAPAEDLAGESRQAKDAIAAGRYEEAITLYSELTRAVPKDAGLIMNLGLAMHQAGRYADALQRFQDAVRLKPDLTPALLFIGLDYAKLRQPEKAIGPLSRALAADPANKIALLELADAFLAVERAEDRRETFPYVV
jgi:tetratricopeptide (TPR) repeat protein